MQSEFLKMDIFFVIASIFTVIIGVLVCLILWKVLQILGKVEEARESLKLFINRWQRRLKFARK